MSEVKQALQWVYTMLETPQPEREHWVKIITEGMRGNAASFVKPEDSPAMLKRTQEELNALVKTVLGKEFEIIGLAPNISYLRVSGTEDFLKAWWVHPFSSPTLAVKHKRLPIIMIVGASILKDKSNVFELPPESYKIFEAQNLIGIT